MQSAQLAGRIESVGLYVWELRQGEEEEVSSIALYCALFETLEKYSIVVSSLRGRLSPVYGDVLVEALYVLVRM